MVEIKYKEIEIECLFDCKRGNSQYTKTYCNQNKGKYEVFTGTTIGHFGFINSYEYDCENLTYSTDGEYAGTLRIITGKHNIGGHRAILIPKSDRLVLEYFKYVLQPIFFLNKKKGDVPSLSWKTLRKLKVFVPIDSEGRYSVEAQYSILNKHKSIETKKNEIQNKLDYINKINVQIISELGNHTKKNVCDLFDVVRGKSIYTKSYCKTNAGLYPVYSAANNEPLGYMNTYDYEGNYISISVNGIAGITQIISGKFSLNADRVILVPKSSNIDLYYVSYILEPTLRSLSKGRKGINNKSEFSKLTPRMINDTEIKIPVNEDGSYDLDKMKEIAQKNQNIIEIKKQLNDKVHEILSTEIIF